MDQLHRLTPLMAPKSIAVIGASDRVDSRGTILWKNIRSAGFTGKAYPINPKYEFLGDEPCFKSIKDLPQVVDVAIIATPVAIIEKLLEEVAATGTRFVILTPSEAIKSADPTWRAMLVTRARMLGLTIVGPDCLGLARPDIRLNASYWETAPAVGPIAFVAQSAVISTSVLAYAEQNKIGFSSLINTSDEIDLRIDEVVDFLAQDPATRVIVLHVEGIRNPREFFSAIREASQKKPVIILRGGKSSQAGQLLSSRMGVPAGDDDAFNAMLERAGAIRVYDLDELLTAIEMFSQRRLPRANRIGIISNGAGFGVLAADAAYKCGVKLATLSRITTERLETIFKSPLAMTNPVDLWADANPRRIKLAVDALNHDDNVDAILVIAAPTVTLPVKQLCDALTYATESTYKPIITAWVSEEHAHEARQYLIAERITALKSPEKAIEAFARLSRYAENKRFITGTIAHHKDVMPMDMESSRALVRQALNKKVYALDELNAKRILANMGLTTASGIFAASAIEAVNAARTLGFPVVLKVLADGVTHKSNVGGVALNISNEEQAKFEAERLLTEVRTRAPYALMRGIFVQRQIRVTNGRELSISVSTDTRFGPTIRVGAGGYMGNIYNDQALQLLPLTEPLARQLIEKPQFAACLNEFRGMPAVNKDALVTLLMRISTLITEIPAIRNLSIDPLLVDEGGCTVLDAHIGLSDARLTKDADAAHLMIAPPAEFTLNAINLKDGAVTLRSIRPEDYEGVKNFLKRLSNRSAYLRFHINSTELAREKIVELTNIDFNREAGIVACDADDAREIRGVARFRRIHGSRVAEFGIVIEDAWQGRGLAKLLMNTLAQEARRMQITELVGYVLKGNENMFNLMRRLGYVRQESNTTDDPFVTFTLKM